MAQSWLNYTRPAMVAASATVTALGAGVHEAQGQNVGTQITNRLADSKFPLSYGLSEQAKADELKAFDFAKQLAGKSYVLVFGFKECQFCNKIGGNLAQLREYMDKTGKQDIPIVVINTRPSKNRSELTGYVEEYTAAGVCKEGMYNKNFYILFPKNEDQAVAMQTAIGGIFNQKDPKAHVTKIVAVDPQGVCTWAEFGALDSEQNLELMRNAKQAINRLPAPVKGKEKK